MQHISLGSLVDKSRLLKERMGYGMLHLDNGESLKDIPTMQIMPVKIQGVGTGCLTIDGEEVDKTIVDTLSKMTLLYDTPFEYLVQDENLLPKESLRFFVLDTYWIKSLMDGALSIGRNTEYDVSHDEYVIDQLFLAALKSNTQIRRNMAPENVSDISHYLYDVIKDIDEGIVYSGFLLHSALVSDFHGLEMVGYGDLPIQMTPEAITEFASIKEPSGQDYYQLPVARLERMSHSVMMGIFCGNIHCLHIKQPKEGMFLGLERNNGNFVKCLRSTTTGKLYDGSNNIAPLEATIFVDEATGVIDFEQSAIQIMNKVNEKEPGAYTGFTSADLALQMIQNGLTGILTGE